jgi:hypothetical protein
MTTEQESQGQEVSKEQWHAGISWNKPPEFADLVKAAVEYTESKQEGKKLPVTCINDFADILSLYVTSGELTPGEFMRCFTLAVEAELKVQQQTMDALTDVLELLGE